MSDGTKPPSGAAHEQAFVQAFISPIKQDRWMQLLPSRRRPKILERLAGWEDFLKDKMFQIPASDSPTEIVERLARLGVDKKTKCWLVSQYEGIDRSELPLSIAICKVFAIGLGTIVSCLPGRVAYYESESGHRYILQSH